MNMIKLAAIAAAIAAGATSLSAPAAAHPGDHMDRGHHEGWDRDHGRHEGWYRGRHRGWHRWHHRHCWWKWHHHHRVRVCSW